MAEKISETRWGHAQKCEKRYWQQIRLVRTDAVQKNIEKYWHWYLQIFKENIKITDKTKILEIGCGPDGMINYIEGGEKYGLDPLMDYFTKNFKMSDKVKWIKAMGEHIPFEDNYFDVVVSTNVLDHVFNPDSFLKEIRRTLKPKGNFFLTVDCCKPLLLRYRKLKEFFHIGDGPHPHSFSIDDVKKILNKNNLSVIFTQAGMGNLGKYSGEDRFVKLSAFKRATKIIKEKGIISLFGAISGKILEIAERKIITREKERVDFIFIAEKNKNGN